jgi:hypothetical protein
LLFYLNTALSFPFHLFFEVANGLNSLVFSTLKLEIKAY